MILEIWAWERFCFSSNRAKEKASKKTLQVGHMRGQRLPDWALHIQLQTWGAASSYDLDFQNFSCHFFTPLVSSFYQFTLP
jgi:hypothetical protein